VAYHVFVDESVRKQYLLCAVWIDLHHVNTTRRALRAMCRPGQRRLHFSKEQDGRRRELLATLATFPIHASLFLAAGHPVDARQRCIQAFVRDAVQKFPMRRADRIVFECRRPPEDDWDRRVIYKELRWTLSCPTSIYTRTRTRCCGRPTPSPGHTCLAGTGDVEPNVSSRKSQPPAEREPGRSPSGEKAGLTSSGYCPRLALAPKLSRSTSKPSTELLSQAPSPSGGVRQP
jgi:hypothetical protein